MKMVSAFTTLVCEECDETVKVRHEGSEKKIGIMKGLLQ